MISAVRTDDESSCDMVGERRESAHTAVVPGFKISGFLPALIGALVLESRESRAANVSARLTERHFQS